MPQLAVISSVALLTVLAVIVRHELHAQQYKPAARHGERQVEATPRAALRRLQPMGAMDPVINFALSEHVAFTTWEPDANGIWHHSHVLARPGWQKTTRCTGNSSMSCEECAGEYNCWSSSNGSRHVSLEAGASHFARYINTIQVRCSSPTVAVKYEVQDLYAGQLRFLWDGVDVSQQGGIVTSGLESSVVDLDGTYTQTTQAEARSGSMSIETEHRGGHTLQIEFTPFDENSNVKLSKLEISMPQTFADCADYQACLDPISESHELRNNNSHQLKCLEDTLPSSGDCARWKGCLAQERQEQLRILLLAAGVGGYKLNATFFEPSASTAANEGECLNPLVQDAESWTCDCFDELHSSCSALAADATNATSPFTDELCMRAKFCEHPRICNAWKEHACDEEDIQHMQTALKSVESGRALSSRRHAGDRGADDSASFDRALMTKSCE